jgi:hypothetical protein
MVPHQKRDRGHAIGQRAWATLGHWGWALPMALAILGILLALLTGDHRLASRSAAVLLVTWALVNAQAFAG